MPSYKTAIVLLALSWTGESFTSQHLPRSKPTTNTKIPSNSMSLRAVTVDGKDFFFADVKNGSQEQPLSPATGEDRSDTLVSRSESMPATRAVQKKMMKKQKVAGAAHKNGIFSPAVLAAKKVIGDENLNKVRAKGISMHSDVIKGFVTTSDSTIGQAALAQLFALADKDGNGKVDKEELAAVMNQLGFVWLKEKQINGILKRADLDGNGTIDFDEFAKEAPKTLKTNLVKLAKKNGGDLGFLV